MRTFFRCFHFFLVSVFFFGSVLFAGSESESLPQGTFVDETKHLRITNSPPSASTNAPLPKLELFPVLDIQKIRLSVRWQMENTNASPRVINVYVRNDTQDELKDLKLDVVLRGKEVGEEQIVPATLSISKNQEAIMALPIYEAKAPTGKFFSIPVPKEIPPMAKPITEVKSVEIFIGNYVRFISEESKPIPEKAHLKSRGE